MSFDVFGLAVVVSVIIWQDYSRELTCNAHRIES